jgi:hypothetical protein
MSLKRIEVVQELFHRGANIEEKDNNGWTPLIFGIFLQLFNFFKSSIYILFIAACNEYIDVFRVFTNRY